MTGIIPLCVWLVYLLHLCTPLVPLSGGISSFVTVAQKGLRENKPHLL